VQGCVAAKRKAAMPLEALARPSRKRRDWERQAQLCCGKDAPLHHPFVWYWYSNCCVNPREALISTARSSHTSLLAECTTLKAQKWCGTIGWRFFSDVLQGHHCFLTDPLAGVYFGCLEDLSLARELVVPRPKSFLSFFRPSCLPALAGA